MISAVVITRNEEKNIKDCLDTIQWVDEIIVVDAESADKTVEIVQNYTDELFLKEWTGFSAAKNFGIQKAQGTWILSVDADERVTPELRDEILAVKDKQDTKDGYYIPRLLFFCGKPVRFGGCYPDYQLRFFKKGKGLFDNKPVHEQVYINGDTGYLKHNLLHYSYNTMKDYWERFNIYTSLDAQKKKETGQFFNFLNLAVFPWELFRRNIIKLGILDGIPGIFYHIFSAVSCLVKYAKLWELK
ncbi:glycosyltransferase family 2 protein [bacterium]